MPARHRAPQPAPLPRVPNDTMLRVGIPVFAVGLIAVVLDVVPFLFGAHDRPLWINLIAVLALPTGLALALVGLLRCARATPAGLSPADPANGSPGNSAGTAGAADDVEGPEPSGQPNSRNGSGNGPRKGRGRHARTLAGFQR